MNEPRILAVALAWIERHCVIPDGFRRGKPFRPYDYQLDYLAAFYTVRGDAQWHPENPLLATAFVYRRGLLVGPQKVGKNPMIAAQVGLEGVGPSLFAGWATGGETYRCADWACGCGWVYRYQPGEPMGMPRPTPLVEITAFSEDATDNTYAALRPMIELGPLHELIPHTGEDFIRLPDLYGGGYDPDNTCRINTVTSSPGSRLGGRVTFAPQDEGGIWTPASGMVKLADTQYRNLAGMGGRASLTTNAWDPSQHSVAQREYESDAADVYRQFVQPPSHLSYANKEERRKIHRAVYPSDTWRENGGHVELDGIEAEAADLVKKDAQQAARFFGNMLVAGSGKAFELERWNALAKRDYSPLPGASITLGFDGSLYDDCTTLIATEIATGHQWPLGIWTPTPQSPIDDALVDAAVAAAFETYAVWRMYADPPYWEGWVSTWVGRYGKERVIEWRTARMRAMALATSAFHTAIETGDLSHDGSALFALHVGNSVRHYIGYKDDQGAPLWVIRKERDKSPNKIDAAVAAILSNQARLDAIAAGVTAAPLTLPDPVVVRAVWR